MDWKNLSKDMSKLFEQQRKDSEEFQKKQEEQNRLDQLERIEELKAFNNRAEILFGKEEEPERKQLKRMELTFD